MIPEEEMDEFDLIWKFNRHEISQKYKDEEGNILQNNSRFNADATKPKPKDYKPRKFKNRKAEVKDFIEFVGFRGYYDANGVLFIDLTYTPELVERDPEGNIINKIEITKDQEAEYIEQGREVIRNYKHPYHPGQAHPPPIDEKGHELGILPHEVQGFIKLRKYLKKGIMFKWPRGFGKTYLATWFMEWTMLCFGYPWLYLSETAILNDVAYWIWQWAKTQNLIINAAKGDKQNTYTQFELTTGGVLRIFKYMDEATTGQHGWYIALDDFIKKGWSDRPSDNERAKRQWNYAHGYIRRKGLMIFGTCKFDGDPLEHMENVVKGIHLDLHTPYIMDGEFPEWEITYDDEDKEVLWVPELYTHAELEAKRVSIAEEADEDPIIAWNAEMMQDTRPSAGGLCSPEDIHYTKRPMFYENVQMCCISVDLAWEDEKSTSDMCAVNSTIMHAVEIEKVWYKRFTVVRSDIYRMPLYDTERDGKMVKGVFTIIEEHWAWLRLNYPGIPLIIAIERNSGGIVIIKVAQRERFKWLWNCIPDRKVAVKFMKDGTTNLPIGITHKKNKVSRVYGELHNSIRSVDEHRGHEVQFEWALEGSTLIAQLLGFPKLRHDDGPDSLGMGKDELNARWKQPSKGNIPREVKQLDKQIEHAAQMHELAGQPWLKDVKRIKQRSKIYRRGF